MIRRTLFVLSLGLVASLLIGAGQPASGPASIYEFELNRIDGKPQSLADFRGKVVMLVNVASKCGYTKQYEGLESLYEEYGAEGLVVLGFPANDFAGQEPGTNAEIADYCRATWSVKFPMFEKIEVTGPNKHPLYAYLTSQPAPIGGEIEWNFQKFLVDRDGKLVERLSSSTRPRDPRVVSQIESLLGGR